MTQQELRNMYSDLMYTGAQTLEKHIRYVAEDVVKSVGDGFNTPEDGWTTRIPWQRHEAGGGYLDVDVFVPRGMHGFALQMLIEAQLREALV